MVLSSKKMDSTMRRSWAHHPPCLERTFRCKHFSEDISLHSGGKDGVALGGYGRYQHLKEKTWSIVRHRPPKVYQVMHFSNTNCLNCQVDNSLSMFSVPSHVPVLLTAQSRSTLIRVSRGAELGERSIPELRIGPLLFLYDLLSAFS
jgi:hypothetical protein